ncbi:MAG: hypothetical protein Q8N91_02230 [Candidatus Omnitrophota bacterium]|nr:hypothetical protein [Candidatus Omnitrophota bacterium]
MRGIVTGMDRITGVRLHNLFAAVFIITSMLASGSYAESAVGGEGWVSAQKQESAGYDFAGYVADKDIKFTLPGGDTVKLEKGVFKKADEIWVPVDEFIKRIDLTFIKQGEDAFTVIIDDGTPIEFKVGVLDGTVNKISFLVLGEAPRAYAGGFFMSLPAIAQVVDCSYNYDKSTNTVDFIKAMAEEFSTFSLPKPPPSKEELKAAIEVKPLPPPDIIEELLPPEYQRDVDLKVDTTLSYLEDKFAHDRTRQADWYLSGRIYDFNAEGHLRMDDVRSVGKQRFKEDGEFASLYRKDIQLKVLDNYLALPQLRSQTQPYFGGEATLIYSPHKTTFIVGETDNTVSGPAAVGAVRYYGNIYYLRQEYTSLRDLFNISGAIIWNQAHAETQSKSSKTDYPRRNFVMLLDSTIHLYPKWDLFYTQALSNYCPDNYVNKRFIDTNWKIGTLLNEKLYSFNMAYEKVGQQYASIGIPSNYQDFEQIDFSSSARFSPNWYGGLSGRVNRNNIERDPRIPTNYENSFAVSTGLLLPWQQNINFSFNLTESKSLGGDVDINGSRYKDYRVDYTKNWASTTLQLSYDHYRLEPFGTTTGGSFTDSYSVTVFQFFPEFNYSYIRLYQDIRKTKTIAAASYTTTLLNTSLGARWNLTNFLSGNIDWRVFTTQREAFQDTAMMNLLCGMEYKSSAVTTWNFDYNLSDFDLYDSKHQTTKHYTLLFKLRHIFDVRSPDKWSAVQAFVYRDLNSNGRFDKGEPGIKGVRVNVVKGRAAYTNSKGIAHIWKVVPGERKVKVDLSNMPLEMAVRGDVPVKSVTAPSLGTAYVEFPIVSTGKIKGIVYIDVNGNGIYDKDIDEPIANARIYLTPSGKETAVYSDGTYTVDYIYPGEHVVAIDLETVSRDYKISSPEKAAVSLHEKEIIDDTNFVFAPRVIEIQSFDKE